MDLIDRFTIGARSLEVICFKTDPQPKNGFQKSESPDNEIRQSWIFYFKYMLPYHL